MTRRLPPSVQPIPPSRGQESVWDYPRPPALLRSTRRVIVRSGTAVLADSRAAWRVLETSHPPNWYIPRSDVDPALIKRSAVRSTVCEWKGAATYWDVINGDSVQHGVGWSYETPTSRFTAITGYLSFMPGSLACTVDDEPVLPQSGGFYGGWITNDVVGPFKGEPGSWGW